VKRVISTFTIMVLFSMQALAVAGPITSGGGDWYAMDFVFTGRDLVRWLRTAQPPGLPAALTADAFEKTIDTTFVESTDDKLTIGNAAKDAINYPLQRKILVNREAWNRTEAAFDRNKLVLHEYLGIMGIPDDKYQISSKVGVIEGPPLQGPPICEGQAHQLADSLGLVNSMNVTELKFLRVVESGGDGHEYYNIRLAGSTNFTCYLAVLSTETKCLVVSVNVDLKCLASAKK
jgi:hypothetical protein